MTNDTARELHSILGLAADFATDAYATSGHGRPFHEKKARALTLEEIGALRARMILARDLLSEAVALLDAQRESGLRGVRG